MRTFYLWLKREIQTSSWVTFFLLDVLWTVAEVVSAQTFLGILLLPVWMGMIFLVCFAAVLTIQHFKGHDDWQTGLNKGLAFGLLAAVPFCFASIFIGLGLGLLELTVGRKYSYVLGEIDQNMRELEAVLRQAARTIGIPRRKISAHLEQTADKLCAAGWLSRGEAAELRHLGFSWKHIYREQNIGIVALLDQSARLKKRYRGRIEQGWDLESES